MTIPNKKRTLLGMPGKNTVKIYASESFYHIYNRGVAKQIIFQDDRDYRMMIHCIRRYLSPQIMTDKSGRPYEKLHGHVRLHAYCLMPTHLHLLIEQLSERGMEQFMRRVMTSYTMYFNWRHNRVGGLFQGRYKGRLVQGDSDLLWLSSYIHENPQDAWSGRELAEYPYSSLKNYTTELAPDWLTVDYIARSDPAASDLVRAG